MTEPLLGQKSAGPPAWTHYVCESCGRILSSAPASFDTEIEVESEDCPTCERNEP